MSTEEYKDLLKKESIPVDVNKKKVFLNEQLLNTIITSPYFSKSKPVIDLAYIDLLLQNYNIGDVREEIKKMNLWLMSNPGREKSNYRKFITNWMSNKYRKIYIDRSA